MDKSQFKVDNVLFTANSISYEYAQLDGENAGRSDDGTMYRDVIGLTNKVSYDFIDFRDEDELSSILQLLEKSSCSLYYYDLKEKGWITKDMYVVGDPVKAKCIGDQFRSEAFQIRFIQMDVDDI